MKLSTQQKKMGEIHGLLSQDLGYIYGERESGPNGAKKEFLNKSAAFLRQLGKDLELKEVKVNTNKSGIACSGDVTIYGLWGENNGLFFMISQSAPSSADLLYRAIKSLKDYSGGCNQWLPISVFRDMDYRRLCDIFLELKREEVKQNAA